MYLPLASCSILILLCRLDAVITASLVGQEEKSPIPSETSSCGNARVQETSFSLSTCWRTKSVQLACICPAPSLTVSKSRDKTKVHYSGKKTRQMENEKDSNSTDSHRQGCTQKAVIGQYSFKNSRMFSCPSFEKCPMQNGAFAYNCCQEFYTYNRLKKVKLVPML